MTGPAVSVAAVMLAVMAPIARAGVLLMNDVCAFWRTTGAGMRRAVHAGPYPTLSPGRA